jgi:hypothetical protein
MNIYTKRLARIGTASAVVMMLLGSAAALPAVDPPYIIDPDPYLTEPSGDTAPCPSEELALIKDYGTPHARVQATVAVRAPSDPRGSFRVEIVYEDSIGRRVTPAAPFVRPEAMTVSLPGDRRGYTNVVKVYARMTGVIAGVICNIGLTDGGPIPELDTKCFESMTGPAGPPITLFEYATPQAAAQMSIGYEARGIGVGFQIYMTNSVGEVGRVGHFLVDPEPRTHQSPGDGRGIYNVRRVALKMEGDVGWWTVLRCSPRMTTGGELSARESQCFANRVVTVANPEFGYASEALLTLESRRTPNGLASATATMRTGGIVDLGLALVPTWEDNGMAPRVFRFPGHGNGIVHATQFNVHQSNTWPMLLKCQVSVARATGNLS